MRSVKGPLKEQIDVTTFSGNIIWGLKDLKMPLNLKTEFVIDETPFKFDLIIKPTKKLNVEDLIKTENGRKMVYQVYNNKIKQVLR